MVSFFSTMLVCESGWGQVYRRTFNLYQENQTEMRGHNDVAVVEAIMRGVLGEELKMDCWLQILLLVGLAAEAEEF